MSNRSREAGTLTNEKPRGSPHDPWLTVLSVLAPVVLITALLFLESQNARLQSATATPDTRSQQHRVIPDALPLGTNAPRLRVRDEAGVLHTRLAAPGTPFIVVFLACKQGVCSVYKSQMEACGNIAERYASTPLTVSVITDVAPSSLASTIRTYDIRVPAYADENGATAKAFHVRDGFELFLVDQGGEIAFRQFAPVSVVNSPLARCLDSLFQVAGRSRREGL